MEVATVLSIIGAVLSLTAKFGDLVKQKKVTEKDKDSLLVGIGQLLDELRFSKDVDANFEYFVAEDLERWLSQLQKSRNLDTIEKAWRKIYEGFDRHIAQGVEIQLPRMEKIASKKSPMPLDQIPVSIRNEATEITHLYPELIELIEEFAKTVRKQSQEIEEKNFKNIGQTAKTLDRQIKRIKMVANTLLRSFCSVVISVYDQLREGVK